MKLFLAPTDLGWYRFLAGQQPEEVNFWQPSASTGFHALDNGDPLKSGHLFLFKLKGSINKIAGGGIFIGYSKLQLTIAWNYFHERNGAASLQEFSESIRGYMSAGNAHAPDPQIGCIILTQPFFWPESLWMPPPADWKRNIVRGKTYSTDTESGRRLYGEVLERLQSPAMQGRKVSIVGTDPFAHDPFEELALNEERYGKLTLIQPRLGQGGFRYAVTERYGRRCAMTGERSLPALEAAHIRPYSEHGPHRVSNGLLLRADLHRLFDAGYITVTPDLRIDVSKQLREEFENGRDYYAMSGRPLIVLPHQVGDKPGREFVEWHNENKFRR
jgi:putative restriction endonuclease